MMKLEEWRNEIDLLDAEIIKLLNQRAMIVRKIGMLKTKAGLPIIDSDREERIMRNIRLNNQGILEESSLVGIYRKIIYESRLIQEDVSNQKINKGVGIY